MFMYIIFYIWESSFFLLLDTMRCYEHNIDRWSHVLIPSFYIHYTIYGIKFLLYGRCFYLPSFFRLWWSGYSGSSKNLTKGNGYFYFMIYIFYAMFIYPLPWCTAQYIVLYINKICIAVYYIDNNMGGLLIHTLSFIFISSFFFLPDLIIKWIRYSNYIKIIQYSFDLNEFIFIIKGRKRRSRRKTLMDVNILWKRNNYLNLIINLG